MLDSCAVQQDVKTVVRLASILNTSTREALQDFGIDAATEDDIVSILSLLGITLSPEDLVDDSFRPRGSVSKEFGIGRFGDGTIGVFYSALDQLTCERELEFHLSIGYCAHGDRKTSFPRFYSLIRCRYSGETADLRGKEDDYPQLVSVTDEGYPFCQGLALRAIDAGVSGFLTASARNERGTCVPVFSRAALSDPQIVSRIKAMICDSGVTFYDD